MSIVYKTIWRYEWITFSRNKTQIVLLSTFFLFGVYAIFCGKTYIEGQRQTIVQLMEREVAEFESYTDSFQNELVSKKAKQLHDLASKPNYAWFRHGYHVISYPHDYADLAIGQRDLYRYYYRLTGMGLQYQLYENEIANPFYLKIGNLDLSFMIIYILPLLIIVFCYSIYSGEKDLGILPLLRVQSVSIQKILLIRLTFYFLLTTGLGLLLSLIGFLVSGGINGYVALVWSAVVIVYCTFWFGLLFFIIAFRQSTSFNAISSVGAWVLILMVIPAILNITLDSIYPLNSTEIAGLTRRTGLDDENDEEESKKVIAKFLKYRPEFAKENSSNNKNLMSKAYAAHTFLKDKDSRETIDRYNKTIYERSRWTSGFNWLNPAVTVQESLSRIVHTDLSNYLDFQTELSSFHVQITDFYFERLFMDKEITLEDYSNRPRFDPYYGRTDWYSVYLDTVIVALLAFIFFFRGILILKRAE
ncbi:DUF3526 domain-containing protein [Flagellimonas eckloniae]|uniref:ABC transporter permease n=1 Tax=Flagellimonas eckloniae TaxID=346185 RepID=A0A0N8WGK2_9FLAO|nr:DUF3526 domain-containing protein [Allomuricauda eckloniae]KQC31731.1 hypothetical protein AAY42_11070 [Allomuricauda eckloniae]